MKFIDKKQCSEASFCPICGENSSVIDTVKTINPDCTETIKLRTCSVCRHWWIDPIPKQEYLSGLYAANSLFVVHKGYAEKSKSSQIDMAYFKVYADRILKFSSKQEKFNFLEIGVGSGHTFNYFVSKANLCYGVEPGYWKPSHPSVVTDIENVPKDIKFDIILVQDVLEHLADPVAMLLKLRSMASTGCVITLGFPNKDSLIAQLLKGKWRMVKPLAHIHFFSQALILKASKKSGWKIILTKECRPAQISGLDAVKQFDWKLFKSPLYGSYKFLKSLVVVQLILGKDQWFVQAKAS